MQISNPFQMNDWEIGKFFKVILSIQFVMWGVIGLDVMGLQIPIIRQFIGFIYLTFVPGILILRVLKIHKLGNIETLLYTVGLSIATLMFTGLLMNTVYPVLGIFVPISVVPLVITISVIVLALCVLCYIRDKDYSDPSFISIGNVLSVPILFLCLLPFLAVFGTYLVYYHESNILLTLLIVIIVFIVCLVGFDRFIPRKVYPLAIFIIAIALLYHRSLISPYLLGPDIPTEYSLCKSVVTNSYWDSSRAISYNALLSVTILPAIYTIILNIDPTWIYKIIYPFILSLVPLGLYHVFQSQMDEKTAFLSAFFFMSFHTFFITLTYMARQQIAELFFVLLILLLLDKKMDAPKRIALSILFSASLIVSHYGLSYIYMLYLPFVLIIFNFMKSKSITKSKNSGINIILYFVMCLTWYMHVSNAALFETLVHIGDHVYTSISTEFFAVEARDPILSKLLGLESALSFWRGIGYKMYQVTLFFIVVGVLKLFLKQREMKFDREYQAYTFTSMLLLLLVIILPFFATNISTSRIYHITLFFLSPFCIIGGVTVISGFLRLFKSKFIYLNSHPTGLLVLVVLIPYFLFSTGFVFEVVGDAPSSLSLGLERMKHNNDVNVTVGFNQDYRWDQEVASAKWLAKTKEKDAKVYADRTCGGTVLTLYGMMHEEISEISKITELTKEEYVYLRYMNVVNGLMIEKLPKYRSGVWNIYNITEISPLFEQKNKIYSNGGSIIYK